MDTPFDQLFSDQNMQLLKLMIPYTPPETQHLLAVYVKFSELQYTIDFFQDFKKEFHTQDFEKKAFSPMEILQEIRPYLPKQISETFDRIMNMMNMMEIFETVREMPGFGGDTDAGFDPMSMMKNMLTPEQQGMFDMYNEMMAQDNSTENNFETKGDEQHD